MIYLCTTRRNYKKNMTPPKKKDKPLNNSVKENFTMYKKKKESLKNV